MIISSLFLPSNTAHTIGISIPNVPHDVPVANAMRHPTINITAGRKLNRLPDADVIAVCTKSFAPIISVVPLSVHANVRISIAGTIALKPSGIASIHLPKSRTPLITYRRIVISSPNKLPIASPTDASLFEKASTKLTPLKNPPV